MTTGRRQRRRRAIKPSGMGTPHTRHSIAEAPAVNETIATHARGIEAGNGPAGPNRGGGPGQVDLRMLARSALARKKRSISRRVLLKLTMANRESAFIEITPEVLLKAYACGIFPMAESADDPALYWIEPEQRGVIPMERFHVPGRLARTVHADRFLVTVNRDFDGVIEGCAESQPDRPRTWINERIRSLYRKLYERRHCHSIEVYEDGELVGGLYGVTLGRAYFGESMFHRA